MLMGNLKDRADAYRVGGDLSAVTVDEFRERVYKLNPLPNGAGKALIQPPNAQRKEDSKVNE